MEATAAKQKILKSLDALAGVWNSSGEVSGPDGSVIQVSGTDAYEWLPGGQFLIHRVDVYVGDEKVDVIEIIGGYDESRQACAMHAFQGDGSYSVMWASIDPNGNLIFADDTMRATLTGGSDGNSMEASWERFDGSAWIHWMDMHFMRTERNAANKSP